MGNKILGLVSDLKHSLFNANKRVIAEEAKNPEPETFEVDGVTIVSELSDAHWDGTDTRYKLTIDGVEFACQVDKYKWSIGPTTHYWVGLDLAKQHAASCIREAGMPAKGKNSRLIEQFYPNDTGPERFNASCETIKEVVALWKVWDKTYRVK